MVVFKMLARTVVWLSSALSNSTLASDAAGAAAPVLSAAAPLLSAATLPNWLYLVAALRALSVGLGYAYPAPLLGETLQSQLFDTANAPAPAAAGGKPPPAPAAARADFTPLAGRTFGVWTAATCAVCLATAAAPGDAHLLRLCAATFGLALAYFFGEVAVYGTVSPAKAARPAFFAVTSLAWCLWELRKLEGAGAGGR